MAPTLLSALRQSAHSAVTDRRVSLNTGRLRVAVLIVWSTGADSRYGTDLCCSVGLMKRYNLCHMVLFGAERVKFIRYLPHLMAGNGISA